MDVLLYRVLVLAWFVAYMGSVYLLLHIVMARFLRGPDSRVLWFFSVVPGPLTRPFRALMPGPSEGRPPLAALGVLVALWLRFRVSVRRVVGVRGASRP